MVEKSHYEDFYNNFTKDHNIKLEKIKGNIGNNNKKYPISIGLFVEIPEKTENGKEIGVRFLILEHESGIEFFMLVVAGLSRSLFSNIAIEIEKEIYKTAIEKSVNYLFSFLKSRWNNILPSYKIAFVEIRQRTKE